MRGRSAPWSRRRHLFGVAALLMLLVGSFLAFTHCPIGIAMTGASRGIPGPVFSGAPAFTVVVVVSPSKIALGNVTNLTAFTTGGVPPYNYSWAPLPSGCADENKYSFVCTPTKTGSYTVGVTVSDSTSRTASNTANLTVNSSMPGGGPPGSNGPSLNYGTIYLYSGLVALTATVAAIAAIEWIRRRRKEKEPMIKFSGNPYVPPRP